MTSLSLAPPNSYRATQGSMATTTYEYDEELPAICARCGEPATTTASKQLHHKEGGGGFILPILLPGLFGWIVIRGSSREWWVTAKLPFCDAHKNGWRAQKIAGWSTFGVILLVLLVLGLVGGAKAADLIIGTIFGGSIIAAFIGLLVAAVLESFTVQVGLLDRKTIKLSGVHEDFVGQVLKLRREQELKKQPPLIGGAFQFPQPTGDSPPDQEDNPFANLG
jgi:hypothetical protein